MIVGYLIIDAVWYLITIATGGAVIASIRKPASSQVGLTISAALVTVSRGPANRRET